MVIDKSLKVREPVDAYGLFGFFFLLFFIAISNPTITEIRQIMFLK